MSKAKIQIVVRKTKGKLEMNSKLRFHLSDYLDEKAKHYRPNKRFHPDEPDKPLPIKGVDYHSEMEQGRITVHGYLKDIFLETFGKPPEHYDRTELAEHVASTMHRAGVRQGRKVSQSQIGHRFVFSLSDAVSKQWRDQHIDVDKTLRNIINETLHRYSQSVMDGAALGYAVGIHHDTDHLHAHVALMAWAENGKALKLSNNHRTTLPNGEVQRFNYLSLLIGTANVVLNEFHQSLTRAESPTLQNQSVQTHLGRWMQMAASDRVNQQNLPPGQKAKATTAELLRLQQLPPEELLEVLDAAYERRRKRHAQLQSDTSPTSKKEIKANQTKIHELISTVYDQRKQLREEERELRKLRRHVMLLKRVSTKAFRALTYPEDTMSNLMYTPELRKEALNNWKDLLMEQLSRSTRDPTGNMDTTLVGHLEPTQLQMLDLTTKEIRALKVELAWNAMHRRNDLDAILREKKAQIEAMSAEITTSKTDLELQVTAQTDEPSPTLQQYAEFRRSPELLTQLGITTTSTKPSGTASDKTPQITITVQPTAPIPTPTNEPTPPTPDNPEGPDTQSQTRV